MTSNPLVGSWRLVSCETRRADGTVRYPLGREAVGMIIYTGDGHMSVAIMRPCRTPLASGDLLGGTDDEKSRTAESYITYCGRYSYLGDSVVHHVELSLFPNWCGGDQERRVELRGDTLTLEASSGIIQGTEQTARLVWERA